MVVVFGTAWVAKKPGALTIVLGLCDVEDPFEPTRVIGVGDGVEETETQDLSTGEARRGRVILPPSISEGLGNGQRRVNRLGAIGGNRTRRSGMP